MRNTVHPAELHHLEKVHEVQEAQERLAEAVVEGAQARAPRDTGAGAASIHAERDAEGHERVSWDPAHDYMMFHELGTEKMPAHPFLRPAVAAVMAGATVQADTSSQTE
jgi:HK97 gp10 family phage protein